MFAISKIIFFCLSAASASRCSSIFVPLVSHLKSYKCMHINIYEISRGFFLFLSTVYFLSFVAFCFAWFTVIRSISLENKARLKYFPCPHSWHSFIFLCPNSLFFLCPFRLSFTIPWHRTGERMIQIFEVPHGLLIIYAKKKLRFAYQTELFKLILLH